jgi:ATP-dependent DNA helicase RecQ
LAQQEILSFNEIFFRPSAVMFTASKNDLSEFEKLHPELEPMIKALLRSYEGIFDFSTTIYEGLLAKFLKTGKDQVILLLRKLHQYGIIQYQPPTDKPQVFLIKSRMYSDDFKIDARALELRKQEHEKRITAIAGYINDSKSCRSNMLADYFGAPHGPKCKICDNCINHSQQDLSAEEFQHLYERIISLTGKETIEINKLVKLLKPNKDSHVWQAIQYLQAEDLIIQDSEGFIKVKI